MAFLYSIETRALTELRIFNFLKFKAEEKFFSSDKIACQSFS